MDGLILFIRLYDERDLLVMQLSFLILVRELLKMEKFV